MDACSEQTSKRTRRDDVPEWKRLEFEEALHRERMGGAGLLKLLLTWFAQRKINAQEFGVACWYSTETNTKGGSYFRYAIPAGRRTGFYQNSVDKVLPGPGPLVFETIPGTSRKEKERTELTVALSAVWERIEQDVLSNPGMLSEIDKRSWPPCYKNHPHSQESV